MKTLELNYQNLNGELIQIKCVDEKLVFNHEDIHEKDEWEPIAAVTNYIFAMDEMAILYGFRDMHKNIDKFLNPVNY